MGGEHALIQTSLSCDRRRSRGLPDVAGDRLFAGDGLVSVDAQKVAIRGYDTVAYFTEGKAVEGDPQFESVWNGARWRFASAEHRDLFTSQPESYAPYFGGFCVMAMGVGATARPDPQAWAIVDGKLYLSADKEGIDEFKRDPATNIAKAEAGWKTLGN